MKPHAAPLVELGIPLLALVVATLFIAGCARVARERLTFVIVGVLGWMALSGVLAASGILARFELRPPPFLLLAAASIALPLTLAFSPVGGRLAFGVPLWVLVAAQSFRLPLELVMHEAAREGVMPVQMSFSGWNFDIVTGATAILVAWLAASKRAPRWLLIGWNVLGSALLLTIVTIAIVSTPRIHAFGQEPERLNTWVAYFPFVWLPTVLVVAAFLGHTIIFRRLFGASAETRGP